MAKIGAAAASVLAVSIALFGNVNQAQVEESQEFSFGRNLLSVPEQNQIALSNLVEMPETSWTLN